MAAMYPQLQDATWLRAQVDAGLSNVQIAQLVGCTKTAVKSALDRHAIYHQRRCAACGASFPANDYRIHIKGCRRAATHRACRHCGQVYALAAHRVHEPRCTQNPAVQALTRQLLDDGAGIIVSSVHYRRIVIGTLAINSMRLRELFGTWAQVATAFGLLYGERAIDRRAAVEVEAGRRLTVAERRILEAESHHGLPVCSVRLVGDEVRYMLR